MADWKAGTPLKEGQLDNPVLHYEILDMDELGIPEVDPADLEQIFNTKGARLKTWNRSKQESGAKDLLNDPHWICTKVGVKMHTDPGFPRYSYQLKMHVDPGTFAKGVGPAEYILMRGVYYVIDTHSPHSVEVRERGSKWNLSASIDSPEPLDIDDTRRRLIEYAKSARVLDGAPA